MGHKAIAVYIPILSLIGLSLILTSGSHGFSNPTGIRGLDKGLIRGTSEMGLGVLASYFFDKKYDVISNHLKTLDFLSIICATAIGFMTFATKDFDYLLVFCIPIILFACFIENSLINKLFRWQKFYLLGELSLYMYVIHIFLAKVYWILLKFDFVADQSVITVGFVYIIVVMIFACSIRWRNKA